MGLESRLDGGAGVADHVVGDVADPGGAAHDEALNVQLREGPVSRTEQLDAGSLVDLAESGELLAIEVIRPARTWPLEQILSRFHLAPGDAKVLRDLWQLSGKDRRFPFAEPTRLAG